MNSSGQNTPSRDTFEPGEIALVLSRYALGPLRTVQPFRRGSSRSAKALIHTYDGNAFLLKRLAHHTNDTDRVRFAQHIVRSLHEHALPVADIIQAKPLARGDEPGWISHAHHKYVLYRFVSGEHYRHTPEESNLAGRALAEFHTVAAEQPLDKAAYQPTYHDNANLPGHLERILKVIKTPDIRRVLSKLRASYANASARANKCGVNDWPNQIIHGDWHPGNILFGPGSPPALPTMIDLDTCRVSPRVIDLANGALQFSITRKHDDPGTWPAELDTGLLSAFCTGYDSMDGAMISTGELQALPWLMIEALIVESAVPIAASGRFAGIDGDTFLQMICRKINWLESTHERLIRALM